MPFTRPRRFLSGGLIPKFPNSLPVRQPVRRESLNAYLPASLPAGLLGGVCWAELLGGPVRQFVRREFLNYLYAFVNRLGLTPIFLYI